jgi:hypothetical protein
MSKWNGEKLMSDTQPTNPPVYQLKITLHGSKPPIWRRVQVASTITLAKLHRIIQIAMGWEDYHLHQFIINNVFYGVPDPDFDKPPMRHEKSVKLGQVVAGAKKKFVHEYDFGNSWQHDIVVERVIPAEEGPRTPLCLEGKRACPPEDCGGIFRYYHFLEAIQDPTHPEHDFLLGWVGGSFDPEAFDIERVNKQFKRMR